MQVTGKVGVSQPANASIIRKSNHKEVINAPIKISNTSSKFKFVPAIVIVLEAIPLNLKPTGFFLARIIFFNLLGLNHPIAFSKCSAFF